MLSKFIKKELSTLPYQNDVITTQYSLYLDALFGVIAAVIICVVISCWSRALLASSAVININTSTKTQLTGADRNKDQVHMNTVNPQSAELPKTLR